RRVQLWFGRLLGILWFDVFRIRRSVVLSNLKLAYPDWSEKERIRVGRESVVGICQILVEVAILVHYRKNQFDRYFIDQLDELKEEYGKGKGVMFLSLHTGNGDLGLAALAQMGMKVNLISKHFK